MSFVGGKLKLKGGAPGIGKKKSKKQSKAVVAVTDEQPVETAAEATKAALEGRPIEGPQSGDDRRTAAEKRYDERFLEAEKRRLARLAQTSHRDRVNEFNEKLAALSEHHDIPKVGPG